MPRAFRGKFFVAGKGIVINIKQVFNVVKCNSCVYWIITGNILAHSISVAKKKN